MAVVMDQSDFATMMASLLGKGENKEITCQLQVSS
jgi:hypothetical protein